LHAGPRGAARDHRLILAITLGGMEGELERVARRGSSVLWPLPRLVLRNSARAGTMVKAKTTRAVGQKGRYHALFQ
jgi:hypothetical protein